MLPLFALANAGVALRADTYSGHERLTAAIARDSWSASRSAPAGLGARGRDAARAQAKGIFVGATRGAAGLGGIGFTMSLFIAGKAFRSAADFEAAKIAVFIASVLSAVIGVALLTLAGRSARA